MALPSVEATLSVSVSEGSPQFYAFETGALAPPHCIQVEGCPVPSSG
jgi:hypothetical protein